ncbi:hypothetical protein RRG08_037403 [Elysia crispata]|uniref:Uncharacterized protein n=1 Tax=Elysia crispata TaxID=231223 RepID=A0AAE1AFK5_9GAST|nr:hypothetical protein RRG08_037403 [Elysia crispata]
MAVRAGLCNALLSTESRAQQLLSPLTQEYPLKVRDQILKKRYSDTEDNHSLRYSHHLPAPSHH